MRLPEAVHRSVEDTVTAEPVDGVRLLHAVHARRARRNTRRRAGAVVVTAAAVAGLAAVPTLLSQDRPAPPPATAPVVEERAYDVLLGRSPSTGRAFGACLALPATGPAAELAPRAGQLPDEDASRVVVTGRQHFAAFASCLSQVPESWVAQTVTTPTVDMPGVPGHPEDVQSAEICLSSNARECHPVPTDQAVELARLFADAAPLRRPDAGCQDAAGTYTVTFDARRSAQDQPVNRLGCGAVAVGGQLWAADAALTDAVRRQYAVQVREVRTLTDQCVGGDRPDAEQDYLGLSTARGRELARSRGLATLVLGEQGCATSTVPYAPGRLVLVVDRGRVVWAGRG